MNPALQFQLLTIDKVAGRLSLELADVEHLVATGQLPEIHIRGRRLFDERDLAKLVNAYKQVQQRRKEDDTW